VRGYFDWTLREQLIQEVKLEQIKRVKPKLIGVARWLLAVGATLYYIS
jgi:hypothetical protein